MVFTEGVGFAGLETRFIVEFCLKAEPNGAVLLFDSCGLFNELLAPAGSTRLRNQNIPSF